MSTRGTWQNRERAEQLLSFVGLEFGTITPTDFDLFIDFGGRSFVLGELKYKGKPLPRGQELALERAVDTWHRAGVESLGIVASHSIATGDAIVADAIVLKRRWRCQWHPATKIETVRAAIVSFDNWCRKQAA